MQHETDAHACSKGSAPTFSGPPNVSITKRRLGYSYDGLPRSWFAGNPVLSSVWNAFAASFPQGERYMMRVARNALGGVRDPKLRDDVLGFIGQEATHALEHDSVNRALLAQGLPMERFEDDLRALLTRMTKHLSPKDDAAAVAALEHFTSMFGHLVLANPEIVDMVDERLRAIFVWHALEETEHKAVAFDLYQAIDGSYVRLRAMYVVFSLAIVAWTLYASGLLSKAHLDPIRGRDVVKAFDFIFGFGEHAGYVRKMLPDYLAFFRPDFHPWQHDNSALITKWSPVLESMLAGNAS